MITHYIVTDLLYGIWNIHARAFKWYVPHRYILFVKTNGRDSSTDFNTNVFYFNFLLDGGNESRTIKIFYGLPNQHFLCAGEYFL